MVTYVEASWRAVVATSLFCAVVIAGLLVARRRGRYRATKNDVGVEARRLFNANSVYSFFSTFLDRTTILFLFSLLFDFFLLRVPCE